MCDADPMTEDDNNWEYDVAVSFAGEQRDYVEAVVRGLGDDIKTFYDADEKARLLGENLIDLLSDLYQHKARYVLMFVSAAYEKKMWPNIERQSAMARAAQQRSAYILPIRMDDTSLPGLLPTVGYLDARHEGLDGIISIIRQKLGSERAHANYSGRVPTSQADIELLLALRPDFWEYWLYAGTMRVGLERLEEKYRDYEIGFATPTGEHYTVHSAADFLGTVAPISLALVNNFNAIMTDHAQERAFGKPGEPGDPARITHLANRFLDIYEGFLDEAARIRGASLPDEFREAQAAAADMGSDAVTEMREFVHRCVDSMNSLPELTEGHVEGEEPVHLTLTVTLTINPEVSARFSAGLRDAAAAHGIDFEIED